MTLTTEQQNLVTENHNLIYKFIHTKNLSVDEFYDICAIALCEAAVDWKDRCKFSTFAWERMNSRLKNYWKYKHKKSKILDNLILSYNTPLKKKGIKTDESYFSILPDDSSLQDTTVSNMFCLMFLNILTDKERMIVKFLVEGKTQEDIADILHCQQSNISQYVTRIKNKWSDYYDSLSA